MSDLKELSTIIRDFAELRHWEKFHTPKNLSMAIAGEAGELAAEFQWLSPEESSALSIDQLNSVKMEIADVAIYLIRLADTLGIDISSAVHEKMKLNEERFPS